MEKSKLSEDALIIKKQKIKEAVIKILTEKKSYFDKIRIKKSHKYLNLIVDVIESAQIKYENHDTRKTLKKLFSLLKEEYITPDLIESIESQKLQEIIDALINENEGSIKHTDKINAIRMIKNLQEQSL